MSTLSPMLAAWYASSPEHGGTNNPASDYINAGGGYPTGAVAAAQIRAAAVAAAAAAAVSNSGSLSSASPSLGNTVTPATSSGLPSLSQAASLASTYPGSMMSGMGYTDRAYENQMGSHCQSNSYSAYQPPPSPYRPHPVSPPAHHAHHQSPYSTSHNSGQMHPPSVPYGSGHQLGLYSPAQAHYGSSSMNNQDVYSGRSPIYGGSSSAHMLQQSLKAQSPATSTSPSLWTHSNHDNSISSNDMLQGYPGMSAVSRQSSLHLGATPSSPMPPPPLRSPPVSMSTSSSHFHRQMPISSSPSHSPHAWSQAGQIPSPGGAVLHSPRASPSPLPNHGRSPGHTRFSPPPPSSTPSPHHHHSSSMGGVPPSPIGSHHSQQCPSKTPPSSTTPPSVPMGSPSQPPSMVGGPSDPLQSLQKMVMLDSEMVSPEASAAVARGHYDIHPGHHTHTPNISSHHSAPHLQVPSHHQHSGSAPSSAASRPSSYFSSVETLAGNDPGSPYPTYYNLDQNRLCTPPRAAGSTPTSSTFTSAPDSASNSSVSVESYPNAPDSSHPTNGEIAQHPQNCNPRDQNNMERNRVPGLDSGDASLMECSLPNGNSGNMMNHYEMPCFMGKKKLTKGGRGRRRSASDDFNMASPIDVGKGDHAPYGLPSMRKPYPGMDSINGQLDYGQDERPPVTKKRGRGNRYTGQPRWAGRMLVGEGDELSGGATAAEEVSGLCSLDEGGVYLSLALKRGQRKKRTVLVPGAGIPDGAMDDPRYSDPANSNFSRSPRGRGMRSPRGSGRRSRRRAGNFNQFVNDRPHFDGGFLEVSGNANDGLSDSNFLGAEQGSRDPSLLGGSIEDDNTPEGNSFLKSGMLEAPRGGTQQELHFSPRSNHLCSPNGGGGVQDCSGSQTGEVYPHSYHPDQSIGMDINMQQPLPFQGQIPMERKRGRPRGSKNKPKQPGDEPTKRSSQGNSKSSAAGSSTAKRLDESIDSDASSFKQKSKSRFAHGPLIHVTGTRQHPLTVEVLNFAPADEMKETSKNAKQIKRPAPTVSSSASSSAAIVRKRLGALGHTSTLSPLYDAFTRDRSWICSLCHNGSHHRGLGDLYGPYFLSDEQQKLADAAAISTPTGPYSSGVPTPTSIPDPEESSKIWDVGPSIASTSSVIPTASLSSHSNSSNVAARPGRGKRKRSDFSEDCLKTNLLKKAKQFLFQGKKSANLLGAGPSNSQMSMGDFGHFETDGGSSTSGGPAGPLTIDGNSVNLPQLGEFWVHEDCAIWSQGVYLLRQQTRGLDDAVKHAADMICCKCKLNGATLGCWNKGCTEQYHFICAKDRGCEMDEDNFSMMCPKHKRKPIKMEIKQEDCSISISSTTSSTPTVALITAVEPNC